ncbi:hypothetical protein [Streptomyces sp. NPDC058108]|uniref:hypothetical protein n=1 Tax=Streptomyces sp. NPDC058108 TaxID=3346344 RepID=UPI0036E66B90
MPLRTLPAAHFGARDYQLAPLVLLDDRSHAAFELRHMPRRPGLIVVCAGIDDATAYPRGAAVGAEAVLWAGQDPSWLHLPPARRHRVLLPPPRRAPDRRHVRPAPAARQLTCRPSG